MKKIIFDMETADPDDLLTLCWLCSHKEIDLKAVTITPGTKLQIGLVKSTLRLLDHAHVPVPVGAFNIDHPKQCVSTFYNKIMDFIEEEADGEGWRVIEDNLEEDTIVVTGAPLKNLGKFLKLSKKSIACWVGQGGFAGVGVVPEHLILKKFKGKVTCPTFNFNGDPQAALALLSSDRIKKILLVSKNVCHDVYYDKSHHNSFIPFTKGMELFYKIMEIYLQKNDHKKLHDPLAATVALNNDICSFEEVEVYREKGEWGSKLKKGTNTFISIDCNKNLFFEILLSI